MKVVVKKYEQHHDCKGFSLCIVGDKLLEVIYSSSTVSVLGASTVFHSQSSNDTYFSVLSC